jgi:hypothetical protein
MIRKIRTRMITMMTRVVVEGDLIFQVEEEVAFFLYCPC